MGRRRINGWYTTEEPPAGWNKNTLGAVDPAGRSRSTRMFPDTSDSSPSRTRLASGSKVSAANTWSAVISVLARSFKRSAIFSATSRVMSGNSEVTPAAAAPVSPAQVANTRRSDASRGATPTPWVAFFSCLTTSSGCASCSATVGFSSGATPAASCGSSSGSSGVLGFSAALGASTGLAGTDSGAGVSCCTATNSSTIRTASATDASRNACTCKLGREKSCSIRFLIRIPMRESNPRSISGNSPGKS